MAAAGDRQARENDPLVTVVIPVLNDAAPLRGLLVQLCRHPGLEIIVVDGGSADRSYDVAAELGCRVIRSCPGRGHQLADGIVHARAPWIWMLHADSEPSPDSLDHLLSRAPNLPAWGRFTVTLAAATGLETVARLMNLRSRLTGICTGDQGIFVHRDLLESAGGMPRQSLMEDIELSKRLKLRQRPDCRPERISTSPRRWRQGGAVRTVLSMWRFRLRYWRGVDAETLAKEYYGR